MVLSLIIFPKMEWRDHFPLEIYLFPGILSWEMGLKGHISTRGEAECGNQPRKSHFPTKYVWKKVNWKWKKVKLPILGKIIKEIAFFDFCRSSGKSLSLEKTFFRVEKSHFPHGKRPFSRESIFPCGKMPKGLFSIWFPNELQWNKIIQL